MIGNPLVVPGSEAIVGISPAEAETLSRSSPEAVAARQASSTAYEGLSPQAAQSLAATTFPALINEPAGGTPALPEGDRVVSYAAPTAATLELPNNAHAALASTEPIAVEGQEGQFLPINLSLTRSGEEFKPTTPDTGAQVSIPVHLAEGVSLTGSGVNLTPVDELGSPLHAEGVIDGASIFYGDSEILTAGVLDTDTVVKPTTYGFATETILRSERSPQKLFFKVALPEGASLSQAATGSLEVVDAGHVIAAIPTPRAHDAEGAPVTTTTTLSGNTIILSVPHQPGEYRMPLAVDPTVIDKALDAGGENLNWASKTTNPNALSLAGGGGEYGFAMVANSITYKYGYAAGESAYYVYPTQGESHIYEAVATVMHERPTSQMQNTLSLASPGSGKEGNEALIPNEWENTTTICAVWPSCEANAVTPTNKENRVFWETRAIESGNTSYTNDMTKAAVYINQEKGLTAKLDTNDPTVSGRTNPLYGNTWAKESSYVGINAFDPGIGANKEILRVKQKPYWEHAKVGEEAPNHCAGAQCEECDEDTCPNSGKGTPAAIYVGWEMPEGEDTIEGEVTDAAGFKATVGPATLKFDNEPPHNLELTGLPPNDEIGDETYPFTVKATDGESATSSGVKSIVVSIDGRKLTENPAASCPLGPCTASGQWTVNGEELGAGPNQVKVVATDNAENVAEKTFTLEVRHATPLPIGPGSVNPQSGQLTLTSPNVSMGDGLTFSSTYRSRNIAGLAGPLGPQWASSIMGQQSITKLPNGSMVLADAAGAQTIFTKKEAGGFEAPTGDTNLTLAEVETEGTRELVLKNATAATSTGFRVPSGGSGELWVPSAEKGALPSETQKYTSETVTVEGKQITRPTLELGPTPTGVTCTVGKEPLKELKTGCRALTFKYATETKVTGENESQWNEYNGRLKEVNFIAYNESTGKMQEVTVAKYLYDNHGRLRAEWDPRVEKSTSCGGACSALKTTYGYDSEGHITAMTLPGQETWAFMYGTTATDASPGRLLKVTQAPASAPLWKGEPAKSTEAPKLSGAPTIGVRMAVSNGTWTGSPVVYGYQWEDCSAGGTECEPIPGATNPNYTPTSSDVGHALVAQVTAVNGSGSVVAGSEASKVVSAVDQLEVHYTSSFGSFGSGSGQLLEPSDLATDASGNVWVADTENARLEEWNAKGELLRTIGSYGTGNGQFEGLYGVTVDSLGNVWTSECGNDRIDEFSSEGAFEHTYGSAGSGNGQFDCPEGLVVDSKGNVYVADRGNHRVEELNSEGKYVRSISKSEEKEGPFDVKLDASGDLWVSYAWESKIGEFSPEGTLMRLWGTEGTAPGDMEDAYRLKIGPEGNIWVAEWGNNRVQVFNQNGEYLFGFGSYGSGEGQFFHARGISISGSNVYVLDSGEWWRNTGNGRVEKWTLKEPIPWYTSSFGSFGSGSGQLLEPSDLATDASGNVWVADTENARLEEWNAKGELLRTIGSYGTGNGQFEGLYGVTVDSLGNVWTSECGNDRIDEFSSEGAFEHTYGSAGSGNGQFDCPEGLVVDSKGNVYVADRGNHRVEELNSEGKYVRSISKSEEKEGPFDVKLDASGDLWVSYAWESKIGEFSPEGTLMRLWGTEGTAPGDMEDAYRLKIGPEGNIWVAEWGNNRVQVFNQNGEYLFGFGSYGSGEGQFFHARGISISGSNVYVLDSGEWWRNTGNGRVEKWGRTEERSEEGELRSPQPGATIEYNVPVSGSSAPYQLGKKEVEEGWAQKDVATEATAIFGRAKPQGWPASNWEGATIYYRDNKGHAVNTANPAGGIATSEYNEYGDVTRTLSPDNRLAALKEGAKSAEVAKKLDTENIYGEKGSRLLETVGPRHEVKLANGKEVLARSHAVYYYDEGAPTEGGPYNLVTKTTQGAQIEGESEQDVRTTTTSYSGQSSLGWKLREPTSVTVDPAGLKLKHTTVYDETTGNVLETWAPKSVGSGDPHDTKTVYYSAETNTSYPRCGKEPQWANLPCETMPGAQPATTGMPSIPVTTVNSYNSLGEPLVTTSTVVECVKVVAGTGKYTNSTCTTSGSGEYETKSYTRTATMTYDEAGRPVTSELASTAGTTLPTETFKYNLGSGLLVSQSQTVEGKTQAVTSEFNKLGQMTAYTDADENTTTYEYNEEKGGRLAKENDGKGTRAYEYNETTGAIDGLTDTEGTDILHFTASYDPEGNLVSQDYPNGMTAHYAQNQIGETTGVSYEKTVDCATKCPETWFSDNAVPSIHSQRLSEHTTLASTTNTYDAVGRLTQVQETPSGEGCTTRVYTYDEETNLTALATHPPGTGGVCSSEGGGSETHSYDSANRLTDTGVAYDPFGDITKLPAADAGGTELQSTFYGDGQLATQTQGAQSIAYDLDPEHRTRMTVDTGTVTSTYISHYASPSGAPAWIVEPTSNHWTRYVSGISGFAAIETETSAPILQVTDLKGNVVAKAALSETATKLLSTERSTAYGVPTTTKPEKYSWLGGDLLPTELPSGVVAMGARSYVPQLARFLQPDPVPGGSANAYSYTYGDPINSSDPSGEYTAGTDEFDENYVHERAKAAAEARAAEIRAAEEAARAEEEQKAREAYLAMMGGPSPTEGAAEPLGGYEGWACEYAAETGQEGEGCPSGGGGGGGEPIAVAAAPCAHGSSPKTNHCNNKGYGEILVNFDGHISTPAQILARALAEYENDNKDVMSIEKGLSELMKGVKETYVPISEAVNGVKVIVWEVMQAIASDP
jgi:RHS repeat-associated protein